MRHRRGEILLSTEAQLDFAWHAHQANVEWVRGVDQKASIVLVFATALAGLVADQALSSDGALSEASGVRLAAVIATGVLFAAAALLSLLVVRPQLRRGAVKSEARSGLVYFGHLHHRSPAEVERALEALTASEARADLARQLAQHGDIGWRKHRRLQWSLNVLVLGVVALALARFVL